MERGHSPRTGQRGQAHQERNNRSRMKVAEGLEQFKQRHRQGLSERDFERQSGIARSTARHWEKRSRTGKLPRELRAALETQAGLKLVTRIVIAAIFVLTLRAPGGIRMVCEFLKLSGLSDLVAPSFGSVQAMTVEMQQELITFGEHQRATLGSTMAEKHITVCQDETFHPETCLVAIEPVSNFIVTERYTENRTTETWKGVMDEALDGLPVQVEQSTADQAKALLRYAEHELEVPHSPDLFHPQNDLVKATALPLSSRVGQASKAYAKAVENTHKVLAKRDAYYNSKRKPGRPPNFAARIEEAERDEQAKRQALEQAEAEQLAVREAIRKLSTIYHPYALADGTPQQPDVGEAAFHQAFADIDEVADRAQLSQRCRDRIDKVRRVVDQMVGTIAVKRFFGQRHDSPFEWLVERMTWPAWPAMQQKQPKTEQVFGRTG